MGWIVPVNLHLKMLRLQWIHEGTLAEIHAAEAVKVLASHHRTNTSEIAKYDRSSNCHRLQGAPCRRENDVVTMKNMLRIRNASTRAKTNDIEFGPHAF